MITGYLSAENNPDFVRGVMGDNYVNTTEDNINRGDPFGIYRSGSPFTMFITIAFNNIKVAFLTFLGGPTFFTFLATGIFLGALSFSTFLAFLSFLGFTSSLTLAALAFFESTIFLALTALTFLSGTIFLEVLIFLRAFHLHSIGFCHGRTGL